jgi:outer membrane protein
MSGFMFSRVLIVISLLGLFFTQTSFGQKGTSSSSPQLSFGAVDINLIVEQMPEAKDADAKLKEMQKQLQDTIMKMQDALQKKVDSYLKQKSVMPADQQQKQEQALQEEQQKMQQFYNERLSEIQNKREEFLEPIRNKVKNAIQAVAKEENLQLVFDKGSLLFVEDKFDITYKVLDKIKRGGK